MSSATLDDVMSELKSLGNRFQQIEDRQAALETAVDGVFDYVRKAVEGDHADVDHAEREAAEALEKLGELELERIGDLEKLENHERKAGGAE